MRPEAARQIADCVRHDWERVMGIKPGMNEAERADAIAQASRYFSNFTQNQRSFPEQSLPTTQTGRSPLDGVAGSSSNGQIIKFPARERAAG